MQQGGLSTHKQQALIPPKPCPHHITRDYLVIIRRASQGVQQFGIQAIHVKNTPSTGRRATMLLKELSFIRGVWKLWAANKRCSITLRPEATHLGLQKHEALAHKVDTSSLSAPRTSTSPDAPSPNHAGFHRNPKAIDNTRGRLLMKCGVLCGLGPASITTGLRALPAFNVYESMLLN